MQLNNKAYRNEHKELTRLLWNKFNVLDFSTRVFFPDFSRAYNIVRVIEDKII